MSSVNTVVARSTTADSEVAFDLESSAARAGTTAYTLMLELGVSYNLLLLDSTGDAL